MRRAPPRRSLIPAREAIFNPPPPPTAAPPPRAQELDPCLVADLDPSTRQNGDPSLEVGRLRALREVERCARGAHLVVEEVQLAVGLLAHVAVLLLDRLARRRFSVGGIEVGR